MGDAAASCPVDRPSVTGLTSVPVGGFLSGSVPGTAEGNGAVDGLLPCGTSVFIGMTPEAAVGAVGGV